MGSKEFYDYHLDLWNKQKSRLNSWFLNIIGFTRSGDKNFPSLGLKSYSFPRSNNLIVDILQNIINFQEKDSHIKIRILIADFTRTSISSKLKEIANLNNADVQVIGRVRDGNLQVERDLINTRVKYFKIHKPPVHPLTRDRRVHNKMMLIDCNYKIAGINKRRKIVFSGSLSYTKWAYNSNSESLVRNLDEETYNEFYDAWNEIRNDSGIQQI